MTYEELCEKSKEAKREAELEIRFAFHRRWGQYLKCGVCGGRLELKLEGKCPHGNHQAVVIENGYSWVGR